jgi:dienelactone hydrolase
MLPRAHLLLIATVIVATILQPAPAEDLRVLPIDKADDKSLDRTTAMMDRYLLGLAQDALFQRTTEYEKLKTPEGIAAYQQRLKEFFIAQLGGFPERTPLNARVTGQDTRDGYRIEKIIFESQPKHFVTAVAYLPLTKPPYPGVLVPCGHSANGKAIEAYQRVCILLAKNGLAALCFDPIGQGERLQISPVNGKAVYGSTLEHTLVGVNSIPLGTAAARYFIWDGIRSLDYLASRPDIDPKRLGCTGNSGGGTQTSYLMALDDRIVCAAPSCYLTSMKRLLETIGPQDAEQNIHAQIAYGMDHADYVIMRAPRPTLLCVATRDFFDITGAWDTYRQAKRIYTRLDHAERVDLIETDATHGFSTQLRVGAVRWMRRWLLGVDDAITETESPVATDAELQCTPSGQVMQLEGARSVFDLNRDWEERLAEKRKALWTKPSEAMEAVRQLTHIRTLAELPPIQVEEKETVERPGYKIQKLVLRPEAGIMLPALAFVPPDADGDAYLYLHGKGKAIDAAAGGLIEKLVNQRHIVLAVDLRGLGETLTTKKTGGFDQMISPDWKNVLLAYMLDKSYVAMRAEDTLACARYLSTFGLKEGARRVHVVGIGEAGPAVLHAAALEPQLFASTTLRQSLVSWANLVRTPESKGQLPNVIHGSLAVYDLQDLAATLPTERIKIEEPLNEREPVK